MNKLKAIAVIFGILFFIVGTAGYIYIILHTENISIIGGADSPTFIFLVNKYGILPALSPIFIIVGVVLVIVSVILKIKRKK